MHDGKAEIKTRKALLYYTLKRLGLDTDPSARAPQDQQIVLLNRAAVLGADKPVIFCRSFHESL